MAMGFGRLLELIMLSGAGYVKLEVGISGSCSRIDQRIVVSTLGTLPADLDAAGITGPAVLFLGLTPRRMAGVELPEVAAKLEATA